MKVMILLDYIARYEEIKVSRKAFERRWKIVGYDELGFAITVDEINRVKRGGTIRYVGGAAGFVTGALICMILQPSSDMFGIGINISFITLLASTGAGIWQGHRIERRQALRTIRRMRQPQVME